MSILTAFDRYFAGATDRYFAGLAGLVNDYREARERRRTQRLISSLPLDIQKDIGLPSAYDAPVRRSPLRR